MNGIAQIHWYVTGGGESYNSATSPFEQLYGYCFDGVATAALALPETVDGGVFVKGMDMKYVLWARTTTDCCESVSVTVNLAGIVRRIRWNGVADTVNGLMIDLTGFPVFWY